MATKSQRDEFRKFLYGLLDHEAECAAENCSKCETAAKVYAAIEAALFKTVKYDRPEPPKGRKRK